MKGKKYKYVIVGAGLAGVSAAEGIREVDRQGSILLLGDEAVPPYHRPPLSKKLWLGTQKPDEIFVHDEAFYSDNRIELKTGTLVTALEPREKTVTVQSGARYRYEKLLLATGGSPKKLEIAGAEPGAIHSVRTIEDYMNLRSLVAAGSRVLVIGGGFIGAEMAAVLAANQAAVSMIFQEAYPIFRLVPPGLGQALVSLYARKGVQVIGGDVPLGMEKQDSQFVVSTRQGRQVATDIVIAGIGIAPETRLAVQAGLSAGNGIVVDPFLRTSFPDIYAAGDNAFFPSPVLGRSMRVEHWDNAQAQGKRAGRNMAGAREPYDHLPYFFSDIFEFGFEAVGEINAALDVQAVWQKENETGILYYLQEGLVRGVMLCNVWGKLDAARELIRKKEKVGKDTLQSALR